MKCKFFKTGFYINDNKIDLNKDKEKEKYNTIFRKGISEKDMKRFYLKTEIDRGSEIKKDYKKGYEKFNLDSLENSNLESLENEIMSTRVDTEPNKINKISKSFKTINSLKSIKTHKIILSNKIIKSSFISNVISYQSKVFKPVEIFTKTTITSNITNLKKQIDNKFNIEKTLVNSDCFTLPYRNHLNTQDTNRKIIEYKNFKNSFIDEIDIQIQKNKLVKNNQRKDEIRRKWWKYLLTCAFHFKRLNITTEQLYNKKYMIVSPYEQLGSKELINAVKDGDLKYVIGILEENCDNKFLFYQTPLHWASKRNHYEIISILIKYGAKVDSEDISGNTPLHLAAERNNIEAVKVLLYELAIPFKRNKMGKIPIELTNNREIQFYLERAKNLHIVNQLDNLLTTFHRIRTGFKFYFDYDDKILFKDMIKNLDVNEMNKNKLKIFI